MWWPDPKSLEEMNVEVTDDGMEFSAPEDSVCGMWLHFWNSTKERHAKFQEEMIKTLTSSCEMHEQINQKLPLQKQAVQ